MRVIDLENINNAMRNETQFVLRCEEVYHDKISAAAASILSTRQERPVVALTGPSGSGKTTTALRLEDYLKNLGVKVCVIHMDNFFLPLDRRPPELTDWESPYCVDVDSLIGCISQLMDGKEVDVPWYDFKNGTTGGYTKMQGYTDAVIIAEGIHMLNPLIFDKIRGVANGVYVAPRTRIITNDDKIVRPEQTTTPVGTASHRRWNVRRAWIGARSTISSPIRKTPPSTLTPSTIMSLASSPNISMRSPASARR